MSSLLAHQSGQRGLLIEVADGDPAGTASAIRLVAADQGIRVVDVVPGACTVLVTLHAASDVFRLEGALGDVSQVPAAVPTESSTVNLDVRYDGADLVAVAELTGLSVDEVISLHSSTTYHASFSGFAPGFVYLTGVPTALRVPRRAAPRQSVPSGAVAIADAFTAVYPRSSPGGWQLLGSTDATLWDSGRQPAALITPGATVRFHPLAGRRP